MQLSISTLRAELADLRTELGRAHSELRRIRLALLGVVTVFLIALAAAASAPRVPDVVRAARFVVVDSLGRDRATLGLAPDTVLLGQHGEAQVIPFGHPVLTLRNTDGSVGALMELRGDRQPALFFPAAGDTLGLLLGSLYDASRGLFAVDSAFRPYLALEAGSRDQHLSFGNPFRAPSLWLSGGLNPTLKMGDSLRERVRLEVHGQPPRGSTYLWLRGVNDFRGAAISLQVDERGGSVTTSGPEGWTVAGLGIGADGEPVYACRAQRAPPDAQFAARHVRDSGTVLLYSCGNAVFRTR